MNYSEFIPVNNKGEGGYVVRVTDSEYQVYFGSALIVDPDNYFPSRQAAVAYIRRIINTTDRAW